MTKSELNLPKMFHITQGTEMGGISMEMYEFIKFLKGFEHIVIFLLAAPEIEKKINLLSNAKSINMNMLEPFGIKDYLKLEAKIEKFDLEKSISLGWMRYGELFGNILRSRLSIPTVGILANARTYQDMNVNRRRVVHLNAKHSHNSKSLILSASDASRDIAIKNGYKPDNIKVFHSGIDTDRFKPNHINSLVSREKLGISQTSTVVGLVGRYHPGKNIPLFVSGCKEIYKENEDTTFLLCGPSMNWDNLELVQLIQNSGLEKQFVLLGTQEKMEEVYPILNLLVVTSKNESGPRVILEAMACGIPCISTNVGAVKHMIGKVNYIFNDNAYDMAQKAIKALSDKDDAVLSEDYLINRVRDNFSLNKTYQSYEEIIKRSME